MKQTLMDFSEDEVKTLEQMFSKPKPKVKKRTKKVKIQEIEERFLKNFPNVDKSKLKLHPTQTGVEFFIDGRLIYKEEIK